MWRPKWPGWTFVIFLNFLFDAVDVPRQPLFKCAVGKKIEVRWVVCIYLFVLLQVHRVVLQVEHLCLLRAVHRTQHSPTASDVSIAPNPSQNWLRDAANSQEVFRKNVVLSCPSFVPTLEAKAASQALGATTVSHHSATSRRVQLG